MEIKIEGNPGTGNTFQEINIGHIEHNYPTATTVTNTYINGAREGTETAEPQSGQSAESVDYSTNLRDTMREPLENIDITPIRTEILNYVSRLRPYLADEYKSSYMKLWDAILALDIIEKYIYLPGKQQDTNFNRNLVAAIIYFLAKRGYFGEERKFNATQMAIALEGSGKHSVRNALKELPPDNIKSRLSTFMESWEL